MAQSPPSPRPEQDTLTEARRLLAEHEQARAEACAAEIDAVLTKYGMRLQAAPAQITLAPTTGGV